MATSRKKEASQTGDEKPDLATVGGVAAGAAVGSLLGPLGAAAGALVGGVAGQNAGNKAATRNGNGPPVKKAVAKVKSQAKGAVAKGKKHK